MGETEKDLVTYGIVDGYETAVKHYSTSIKSLLALIEAGKIKTVEEVIDYVVKQSYMHKGYLAEMKEFLEEQESIEDDIQAAVDTLLSAFSRLQQ